MDITPGADRTAPAVTGGCLCGAVRFRLHGVLRPVVNCHCSQCRRTHGHFGAYTQVRNEGLGMIADGGLRWYRSSTTARRGFCGECGASLFYRADGAGGTSVAAGALDPPTGLRTVCHIYTDDAGDYYVIDDGLPRHGAGGHFGDAGETP